MKSEGNRVKRKKTKEGKEKMERVGNTKLNSIEK